MEEDRLQLDKALFKRRKRTDFNSTRLSSNDGRGHTSTRQGSPQTMEEDRLQLDKTLFKLRKRTDFNSTRLFSNKGRGQTSTRRRTWSNCLKYSALTVEEDRPTTRPKTSLLVVKFNVALRPQRPYGQLQTGAQDVHLDFHTAPEHWYRKHTKLYSLTYRSLQSELDFCVLLHNGTHRENEIDLQKAGDFYTCIHTVSSF